MRPSEFLHPSLAIFLSFAQLVQGFPSIDRLSELFDYQSRYCTCCISNSPPASCSLQEFRCEAELTQAICSDYNDFQQTTTTTTISPIRKRKRRPASGWTSKAGVCCECCLGKKEVCEHYHMSTDSCARTDIFFYCCGMYS